MHSYMMQFAFQASSDGTLAAIDLGMNGFLTIEIRSGAISLITEDGADALGGPEQVTDNAWHDVALTYSQVRQKLALYLDGALLGEHDTREGSNVRELFPQAIIRGDPAASGRPAAPSVVQLRDLFINRTSLHAMEVKERPTTPWVGAGSLDVYAPLRQQRTEPDVTNDSGTTLSGCASPRSKTTTRTAHTSRSSTSGRSQPLAIRRAESAP